MLQRVEVNRGDDRGTSGRREGRAMEGEEEPFAELRCSGHRLNNGLLDFSTPPRSAGSEHVASEVSAGLARIPPPVFCFPHTGV
ncbi:hypothetical protein CgunFtcFv8_018226 [Champsocephalus gunnari]|uniref:Uncharacterized protein n=1 Tax=Champsocephalus gunnari TaxID=52237 RepID=A0AAN8DMU3_CHAGU|nr:hypothetical protein CgunFtcFv8_018226 [Champsocephalus gunnari]